MVVKRSKVKSFQELKIYQFDIQIKWTDSSSPETLKLLIFETLMFIAGYQDVTSFASSYLS